MTILSPEDLRVANDITTSEGLSMLSVAVQQTGSEFPLSSIATGTIGYLAGLAAANSGQAFSPPELVLE
jgi:hypothetical protein